MLFLFKLKTKPDDLTGRTNRKTVMAKKTLCFYLSKERTMGDSYLVLANNRDDKELSIPLMYSVLSNVTSEEVEKCFMEKFNAEVNRLKDTKHTYKLLFNRESYIGAKSGVMYHVAGFSEEEINRFASVMR